jgi:transcriptional regulator with XRE-family HTH domain
MLHRGIVINMMDDSILIVPQRRGQTFAEIMKNARGRMGMKQRELAGALGTTANTIARWEADRAVPDLRGAVEHALDALERMGSKFWGPGMLRPLSQWICDTCGGLIETANAGWLEWIRSERDRTNRQFKIVHQFVSSPRQIGARCYQHEEKAGRADNHLEYFAMGAKREHSLLPPGSSLEWPGLVVADLAEYLELHFRLYVPFYEEARLYCDLAIRDGRIEKQRDLYEGTTLDYADMIQSYGPLKLPVSRKIGTGENNNRSARRTDHRY